MSSAKFVAEIREKLWNVRALSTVEPCTCEYATLLQPFHRGTFSVSLEKDFIFKFCTYFSASFTFYYLVLYT